jgi:hypothetical protein
MCLAFADQIFLKIIKINLRIYLNLAILPINLEKAKPVARRERKATGFKDEAGLPGRGSAAFLFGWHF